MNREQSDQLTRLVRTLDSKIGCGTSMGRDVCTRGYECRACSQLRAGLATLREIFPTLGPSVIPEPKIHVLGADDILSAGEATKLFTKKMRRFGL